MHIKKLYQPIQLCLVVLLSLQFLMACSPEIDTRKQVHTDIKAVIEKRKQAIETKDLEAYKQLFIPEYMDVGVDRQALVADMKNHFSTAEKIEFTYEKNPMNFKMNTARMVAMVSYKTEKMEKPVFHHEKTIFRRVDGEWFISGGVAIGLF